MVYNRTNPRTQLSGGAVQCRAGSRAASGPLGRRSMVVLSPAAAVAVPMGDWAGRVYGGGRQHRELGLWVSYACLLTGRLLPRTLVD